MDGNDMARSQLQIKRMLQYFVDATVEIIEEEGIELGLTEDIKPLLYDPDLTSRSLSLLQLAKKEQELDDQMIADVNEMNVLIWEGMLTMILNKRRDMDPEEAVQKTMKYIRNTMTIIENSSSSR